MNGKIAIPKKFYFILFASVIAICLFSFTIGRELYADKTESIFSFGLIHFSGYLFFLLMPVELAFIYYLPFYSGFDLIAAALVTAIGAQCIDYIIGRLLRPNKIIELMGQKRIAKAEGKIEKFGMLTIFVFNLLPLSSPVIALAAGMLRYNFRRFLLTSTCGLLLKYLVIFWIFS
ncbi:VTT domain-containing protein [Draconibacterium sp. IB214405]|uniref:DedA family protein n=1 Tax=Draconibacterium sp. IB214405 TaxID=3097352 RepID=UPI002A0C850E|nr:VTT domain-containing protein [Draconibacterium sp. IB214405]MDX8341201.1 VTT domain-containing protein [Draconibacterium sp. IB214405]